MADPFGVLIPFDIQPPAHAGRPRTAMSIIAAEALIRKFGIASNKHAAKEGARWPFWR